MTAHAAMACGVMGRGVMAYGVTRASGKQLEPSVPKSWHPRLGAPPNLQVGCEATNMSPARPADVLHVVAPAAFLLLLDVGCARRAVHLQLAPPRAEEVLNGREVLLVHVHVLPEPASVEHVSRFTNC